MLGPHEGVAVVLGRIESLFDGKRAGPADQVERGTGLVVGAGFAGAAKRLLAHHRAGGFVVDVKVTRGAVSCRPFPRPGARWQRSPR